MTCLDVFPNRCNWCDGCKAYVDAVDRSKRELGQGRQIELRDKNPCLKFGEAHVNAE